MKEVVVASNHNGWNFSRIFTLMLLIAIAITITLMVAASLCAILLHLFGSTQGEEKKRQTGRFLNLNNFALSGQCGNGIARHWRSHARF